MRKLLMVALLLCGTASADELVVNYGDSEALYTGRIQSLDTEGMAGYMYFVSDGYPPSVSQWAGDVPLLTGLWHVGISEPAGNKRQTQPLGGIGNCYGTIGYMADHGARIVLTCASWDVE